MDKIEFTLEGIRTTEFCVFELKQKVEGLKGVISYNITPAIGVSIEKKRVHVKIAIIGKIINSNEDYCKVKTVFTFSVKELDKIAKLNEDKKVSFNDKKLEQDLLKSLISISFSTMRGIMMEKGSGTLLQRDFLPLVDPKVFMANKIEN